MITGKTRIFFMLADPIHHVRTPEVLNPLFMARGIDAVMVPVHYAPADFAAAWQAMKRMRNLGGMVISVPMKEQAVELADHVGDEAGWPGAARGRGEAGGVDLRLERCDGGRPRPPRTLGRGLAHRPSLTCWRSDTGSM